MEEVGEKCYIYDNYQKCFISHDDVPRSYSEAFINTIQDVVIDKDRFVYIPESCIQIIQDFEKEGVVIAT